MVQIFPWFKIFQTSLIFISLFQIMIMKITIKLKTTLIFTTLSLISCPWNMDNFFLMCYFFCKVLNGYINVGISSVAQFYSTLLGTV